MNRVLVLDFSLGGATAMLTSGARLSKAAFIDYCARNTGHDDCGWLAAGGVEFAAIDGAAYERDNRDPRVGVTVAVDPALSQAMTDESLSVLTTDTLVINLGVTGAIPEAMKAADMAARVPGAEYRTVEGAAHFSFLATCSTFGVFMIGVAGDDNICSDRGLRDRDDVHAELATLIGDFLESRLAAR